MTIHIDDLEMESTPLKGVAGMRYTFEIMQDKTGQSIKLLFAFVHPFSFFELTQEVVERNLGVHEETAVIALYYFIILHIFLRNITYNSFKNIIQCNEAE